MERVNKLLFHPEYQKHLQRILDAEKTREYCGHDLDHFLDVARLSWIYCLENHLDYKRDVIYATALMHDIGRSLQYTEGISHDEASVGLCEKLLPECGFSEEEILMIQDAIGEHRQSARADKPETDPEDILKSASGNIMKDVSDDVTTAISGEMINNMTSMSDILYYADHKSRKCYCCQAERTCYWPKEKKNMIITT